MLFSIEILLYLIYNMLKFRDKLRLFDLSDTLIFQTAIVKNSAESDSVTQPFEVLNIGILT